jgi:hypothetical protein
MFLCLNPTVLRRAGLALSASFVFALAGCGPQTGDVSGHVTYKGEPLVGGTVSIVSDDGKTETCAVADGSYFLYRVPVGHARFAVAGRTHLVELKPGEDFRGKLMAEAHKAAAEGREMKPDPAVVPPQFGQVATSALEYVVKPGPQRYDLELEPPEESK